MALTINTNISSLITQRNLTNATNALTVSLERMSTGYKINHSKDNAAGFSIASNWKTLLGSIDVASENASMGLDLLTTAEESYALITSHLQRVRDLTEQAANATYGTTSLAAIKQEIQARLEEIDRISANTEYNGIELMKNGTPALRLQVGINGDSNSAINLESSLFQSARATALVGAAADSFASSWTRIDNTDIASKLAIIDAGLTNISNRVTKLGAAQNKVQSALDSLTVQSENLTSSLSTIRDTDVAQESSKYIQAQILQQASATLLSTANQSPSIALNLI